MGTRTREKPRRGQIGAAFAVAIAAAIAGGCARGDESICASTTPLPSASALPSVSTTATAAPSPKGTPGATAKAGAQEDERSITVSIASVGDDHVLPIEALRGAIDEPIVLLANVTPPRRRPPPPPAPSGSASASAAPSESSSASAAPPQPPPPPLPEKERVAIAITSAFTSGEAAVPLRIVDPISGEDVTSIEVAPGQRVYLRIQGDGFDHEATYRANLTLFGAEPQVYRLKIKSTSPWRPLGLRSLKWAETFDDWPISGRQPLRLVLPVESAGPGNEPFHIVVKPPAEAIEGAKPLPACGIAVRPIPGRSDAVSVELPPLDTGRYAGTISIQGEPLAVDLTLKNPFWVVWALVAAGALVSLLVREYVRYRTAREAVERKIAAKEREIEKKSEGLVAWDELCARNVVRMARGRKSYLALDDAEEILPDATPRERPERAAIGKALVETPLPEPLRAALSGKLLRLSRTSSRLDAADLDRALAEMAKSAQRGFASELSAWLSDLRKKLTATESRVLAKIEAGALGDDARGAGRVQQALRVLATLVDDARAVVIDGGLSQGHAQVLAGVSLAIPTLEAWVEQKQIPEAIVDVIHATLWAVPMVTAESEEAAEIPVGLRIRARGVGDDLNAQEEILFELVGPEGDIGKARAVEIAEPIEWIVDRRTAVARGGPRLTFVFEAALLWAGLRSRRVIARAQQGMIAEWRGEILRPMRSIAVVERLWAAAARGAATLVGVIVAGAAAVGMFWSGKPFGSAADYVGALLTGLGADLTVVAGGGKLLTRIIDSFTKSEKKEDAA